jgi:putative DNA primase/helicase
MSATLSDKAAHKDIISNNSSEWQEVSKNNPCPICGKPDWCSVSPDNNAVLCRRVDTAPPGWKHIKDSKDGYPVFALEDGNFKQSSKSKKRVTAKPVVRSVPLPTDCTLVELSAIPADIPKIEKSKNRNGEEISRIRYIYSDDKCIIREQWKDEKNPKGYAKKFSPCRKELDNYGSPTFIYNKGSEPWGLYRLDEILREIKDTDGTPLILFQEGEGCVEIARSLGIASTCVDGSSWGEGVLSTAVQPLVAAGAGIVFLADNDPTGDKKAKVVEKVCNTLRMSCIVIKASEIYNEIPHGGDIKEIMEKLDKEEFINRLQAEIHKAVNARSVLALESDRDDGQESDNDNGQSTKPAKELPKHNAMATLLKPLLRNLKYRDDYHQWMRYKDGFWTVASEESIFQSVTDCIEELFPGIGFSSSYPSGVAKMLISRLLCTKWPEQPRHLLPFKNGILDLNTKKLLRHSPDFGFENIIDRTHNPEATDWSAISDWMDFIFEGNEHQKHLLICWYAAVLRGMYNLHRFALLVGEGGTGKSTAMQLATDLIGKRASHSLTLNALNTNSFQTGNIYDKRLVCLNDADRYVGDLGVFKNITGGDEINVEWKFQKSFNAKYKGLVMASANNPVFTSNDSGLDRRLLLFRFDRKVDQIDPGFSERLSAQTDAFTNYLLSIPESHIIETLIKKTDLSGVRIQNELEALIQTNNVAAWLDANLMYDPAGEIQIGSDKEKVSQLYGHYHDFCLRSGLKNVRSSTSFSPEILRLSKGLLSKVRSSHGFAIKGIRFCEDGGLLESLKKMQNVDFPSNPTHPTDPAQNAGNADYTKDTDVQTLGLNPASTIHKTQNHHQEQMQSYVELDPDSTSTIHRTQSHIQQQSQPLNNPKVQSVQGFGKNTRSSENQLIIGIDRQADYLGEIVTIVGFNSKKNTVVIQHATGREETVKRAVLKAPAIKK